MGISKYIYIIYVHYIHTYTWTKRLKSQIQDIMLFIRGSGQSRAKPCWTSPCIGGPYSRQDGERCSVSAWWHWNPWETEVKQTMRFKNPWNFVFSQDFRQNMTKDMAISKAWHAVLGDFTAFQTSSLGLPVSTQITAKSLVAPSGIQR